MARGVADRRALRVTRVIPAPRHEVFRAWTTPEEIARWWARPWGMRVPSAEVDLRVGGEYRIVMQPPLGREVVVVGTYREVDPPRRLVYTMAWQRGARRSGRMLVTVEFIARETQTEIVITHERCRNAASRQFHRAGWRSSMKRLVALVSLAEPAGS